MDNITEPTIRAYLRVSTDAQDTANQKLGVLEYIVKQGWRAPAIVEDTASGKTPWRERGIGALLDTATSGDIIVVAEISRLARSTLQVLEILHEAAAKGLAVHIVKSNMVMDGSLQSKITATILGLAAEIEREFIVSRTTEALRKRKEAGLPMGRPVGQAEKLALDEKAAEIDGYLKIRLNKRAIAKLVGCAPGTLYDWLDRRRPSWRKRNGTSAYGQATTS